MKVNWNNYVHSVRVNWSSYVHSVGVNWNNAVHAMGINWDNYVHAVRVNWSDYAHTTQVNMQSIGDSFESTFGDLNLSDIGDNISHEFKAQLAHDRYWEHKWHDFTTKIRLDVTGQINKGIQWLTSPFQAEIAKRGCQNQGGSFVQCLAIGIVVGAAAREERKKRCEKNPEAAECKDYGFY